MLYLEHTPAPPLNRFVRLLWYTRTRQLDHQRERILPTGCAQIVVSLSRDFLLDCPEGGPPLRTAPAMLVAQRSTYEIVDTSDLADLIGCLFLPGVLPLLLADRADLVSNCHVPLEHIWPRDAHYLIDQLREVSSPRERLLIFERFLLTTLTAPLERLGDVVHPAVKFALHQFGQPAAVANIREIAQRIGCSERRFSQLFREQVGFAPKAWCRIQRFQEALRHLNAGLEMRWAELALDCGFYDQAHFANEFRAFSGIDASTYTSKRTPLWTNHVRV
jgi:AraC-like DNA-binding protein